ncbi:MAG: hypothetical protein WA057_04215 [Candidatus Magasanikiibacteriota bacterium]
MLRKDFDDLDYEDRIACPGGIEFRVMGFYNTTTHGVLFKLQTGPGSHYYGMDDAGQVFRVVSFNHGDESTIKIELVPELNQEGVRVFPAMMITSEEYADPGYGTDPSWFVPLEPIPTILQ